MKKQAAPSTFQAEKKSVFHCDLCDYTSKSERGLKTHTGHKHKEQLLEDVTETSLKLSASNEVREVERTILMAECTLNADGDDVRLFQCDECDYTYENETQLNTHIQSVHTLNPTNVPILNEDIERYVLEFNECKKGGTGDIPKYYMKFALPMPPPIGDFVKTHPFDKMGHIRKG